MVGKRQVNHWDPLILASGGSIVKNLFAGRKSFLSLSLHCPIKQDLRKASACVLPGDGCWQSINRSYTIAASRSWSRPSQTMYAGIGAIFISISSFWTFEACCTMASTAWLPDWKTASISASVRFLILTVSRSVLSSTMA